ncbi:MAG: DUF721 domain-containing protein [Dehalobacterium sp.]
MEKINKLVDVTLNKLGLKTRALEYKVMELWESVVGEMIIKHASVVEMHRGVLFVHVDHPVWIQHLSFAAQDIKNRLNETIGEKVVKEIRFKAGNRCNEQKIKQDIGKTASRKRALSFEELEKIEAMVKEIGDLEIRKVVASLIRQGKIITLEKQEAGWIECSLCGMMIEPKKKKCFYCGLKELESLRRKTRFLLWELPWLSYQEISSHISGLNKDIYDTVRREMIQELWLQIRTAAKSRNGQKIPNAHVQTYVMLRTRMSPEKLTPEIIWQTLGENIANKLLGGQ